MLRSNSTKLKSRRRGSITVLVAVCLIAIVGIVAIAVDGGLMQNNKRQVQSGADAAALAAATELFRNYSAITATAPDPGGKGLAAALAYASQNGYSNDGAVSSVVVNIPPMSGPFTGSLGYAEVIVTFNQPRYFSAIWGQSKLPITARAVAKGRWGDSGNGVITLDPTVAHALDASGTGAVTVTGGAAMVVDSSNSSAGRATGGGTLTANDFRITGNYVGTFNGSVETGTLPIPDPLAYLPVPSVPPNGTMTKKNNPGEIPGTTYTLTPGRYTSLPNFSQNDTVILKQASANRNGGIYYIDGKGLTSTGATIIMDSLTTGGVMIYNAPSGTQSSEGINISGNPAGTVILSPLTSGPYAGILMWQARSSPVSMSVSGNGVFKLAGTFYTANALLNVVGNGTSTIGSQYISRTLSLSGNGNVTIDYSENKTARTRVIALVE